ncbi:MAG: adenylate/guanylate cyclase domain-containing protein, partial [Candidatus Binatia bacterium]
MEEQTPNLIVAAVSIGMGLSFLAADPETPTSRALALLLSLFGITVIVHVFDAVGLLPAHPRLWTRLKAVGEGATLAAGFEWVLRVGRTKPLSDPIARSGEGLLRAAQGFAVLFALLGIVLPDLRAEILDERWQVRNLLRPGYYVLVTPFYASMILSGVRIAQLLRLELDHSEKVRLVALAIATPFFAAMMLAPARWGSFLAVVGELIFLGGAVRYHVLQGQRGQFLARFLSPQVARQVHERGLSSTMQQQRVQLSVVACDLRGFTSFAETAAPEEVIQFLREYYQAIGDAVTEFGGTIKDFAGDGVLTLVGAPIAYADHAPRAVRMALRIRENAARVIERWRRLGLELGLGVGVASGFVTVGAISGAGRFEYAAVGPAVNLAARLCDRAEAGRILVDQRTVGLVGDDVAPGVLERLDAVELKGVARPVTVYA